MTSVSLEFKWSQNAAQNSDQRSVAPPEGLLQMHRLLERQYRQLPWPSSVRQVVVLTSVEGGNGDLAAAAKAIHVLHRLSPQLSIEWVIRADLSNLKPSAVSFLSPSDVLKTKIRQWHTKPEESAPIDLLVMGPTGCMDSADYLESRILRKIRGLMFNFLEIARETSHHFNVAIAKREIEKSSLYSNIHGILFSPQSVRNLSMGLQNGSGIFLDEGRLNAPRSRGHCCPSYLLKIEDTGLRSDILQALGVDDGKSLPDFDKYSFNSGYAHKVRSHGRFIDFIAAHERKKNVVVVLNPTREKYNAQEFCANIFTSERLVWLEQQGFKTVGIRWEHESIKVQTSTQQERNFYVILRPSFSPQDMKWLQLASDRLLATGDNTPAEAFAACCILYLYENIDDLVMNLRIKTKFTNQQAAIAYNIYPPLGEFVRIGATLGELSSEEKKRAVEILQDPNLSTATLEFCNFITNHYSFAPVLESSLNRSLWLHTKPELIKEEVDALEEHAQTGLVQFLKSFDSPALTLELNNLPALAERLQQKVQNF
jgi:hypothetical protein